MRTVIFGIDGLTFRIVHPLIERGVLPNFQRVRANGCEAVLESKYPPLTPPPWTSLSTGLKPASHGVYDFWTYDYDEEQEHSTGGHEGVLYAYGAPFKRGFTGPNAEIYDLAPTVLRAMNLPLPHTFDGCVLDELFVEEQQAEVSPPEEEGVTRRKLQKL